MSDESSTTLHLVTGQSVTVSNPVQQTLEALAPVALPAFGLAQLNGANGPVYVRPEHVTHVEASADVFVRCRAERTMALAIETVHVTKPGERAAATLQALAGKLDLKELTSDGHGVVRFRLDASSGLDAYNLVTGWLDEIDVDWTDCLHISRPAR